MLLRFWADYAMFAFFAIVGAFILFGFASILIGIFRRADIRRENVGRASARPSDQIEVWPTSAGGIGGSHDTSTLAQYDMSHDVTDAGRDFAGESYDVGSDSGSGDFGGGDAGGGGDSGGGS